MSFQEPTYEEYKSATGFAKFKYKYGIIIMILCWLCLLFICYYMYSNGEAISTNPFVYGAEKYEVECYCYKPGGNMGQRIEFYVNGSSIWSSVG